MPNPSLYELISAAKQDGGYLNEQQQESLYILLAKGCRAKMRNRLARRVALPLSLWENYGIYRRVEVGDSSVSYCAGQSYPDEIRTVRECVSGG